MKVIFDENVPWPLWKLLIGHEVTSVQREGFGGMENGELLDQLDGRFDVFVLCDKNLRYQQDLSERKISIVELPTNRWPILQSLKSELNEALAQATIGSYQTIPGER